MFRCLRSRTVRRGLNTAWRALVPGALGLAVLAGASLQPFAPVRAQDETSPIPPSEEKGTPHRKSQRSRPKPEATAPASAENPTPSPPKPATGAAAGAEPQKASPPKPAAPAPDGTLTPAVSPKAAEGTPLPGAAPAHAIVGPWKMYWYSENKTSELRIAQVTPRAGVTSFVGALATLEGQICPMTGNVVDNFTGSFTDGLETPSLSVAAFVVIHAQCPQKQIWIEALGMPAGKVLMNGRLTAIAPNGDMAHTSIGLGR